MNTTIDFIYDINVRKEGFLIKHELQDFMRFKNMILHRLGAIVILSFLISQLLCAQAKDEVINILVEKLEESTEKQVLESVYLQTSKNIYETGEILWFKGYVLENQSLFPSTLSKTMYVQLVNEGTNQAVWEEKYEVENGFVDGHIYLGDTLQEGAYFLTAYTPYSFSIDSQAITAIRRIAIAKDIESYLQRNREDTLLISKGDHSIIDFQVYPEGGHLVSGIPSKVAFKAVDSNGDPKEVSGILYENNTPKVKFITEHAGMGLLSFTPYINNEYHIKLDSFEANPHYALPSIKPEGYALQVVSNNKETLVIKVSKSTNDKKETLYVRVLMRGVIYSVAKAPVQKEQLIKIPLHDLPQGIAEITLFNPELEPLAERLVYVNPDKKIQIEAELIKDAFVTRDKAILKLSTTDGNGSPVSAHLGLSVFDKVYTNPKNSKSILSHYHLFTQLKGRIFNPGYYFDETKEDRFRGLDLLLLTQGWRRFVWNEEYLALQNLSREPIIRNGVEGKLSYLKRKKSSAPQIMLMVYDPLEEDGKSIVQLDDKNEFVLTPNELRIGKRLFVKHFGADNEKIQLTLADPFNAINENRKTKDYAYPSTVADDNQENLGLNRTSGSIQDGIVLEEFVVSAKRKFNYRDKYFEKLDSLAKLELTTDYVCEFSSILNCPNHPKSDKSKKPVEGEIYLELMVWQNDRWVTGVPKNEGDIFMNPPLPPYRYPKLSDAYLMKMFNVIQAEGYYGKREFYNPIYDELLVNDPLPDFRNTLYWKADIVTNNQGEAQIEFTTSDISSKFMIIVEGVSGDGQLGHRTSEFNVIKR